MMNPPGVARALVALLGATVLFSGVVAARELSAAGYVLAGIAYLAIASGRRPIAAGLGGAVLALSIALAARPRPIELSTAVLALSGAALVVGLWARHVPVRLSLALAGAVAAALGAFGFLQPAPPGIAVAGVASGLALVAAHSAAPRGPLGIGLGGIVIAALLWQGLNARERVLVQRNIAVSLDTIRRECSSELEARVLALVRIGSRFAQRATSRESFELDASLSYTHFPGYHVIGWIDRAHVLRWTWPVQDSEDAIEFDIEREPRYRAAIAAAAAARAPRFTLPMALPKGGSGFVAVVPVGDADRNGFVSGSFRSQELFDRLLGHVAYGYGIRIAAGGETVYERRGDPTPPAERTFLLGGITWRVSALPPRSLLVGSALPEAMFAAAALLSILLSLAVHFALVARELAATLEQRAETAVKGRQDAESALRQAQKLESIGQLTGGIAHDFSNMLTVISGNLEIIAGKLRNDPRLLRLVKSAAAAAERGERLTAQLLAFSRRQQLHPSPLDLGAVVNEMRDILDRTVGDRVELAFALASDLRSAMVDRNQLELALLNLVINARAATPDNGRVEVRAANAHRDFVELSVADTGHGMSEEVRSRAFEPFFTTKGLGKGTGLGLSMVQGFAEQSGGEVHLESTEGVGTVVRLLLPVAAEPATPAAEPAPPQVRGRGETVLCVEDQPDVLDFAAETLEGLGYKVARAADADAALEILERHDRAVDLVFTDVMMPGRMDGVELANVIRSRWPKLPVLLTSGYAERRVTPESPFPFLRKPYNAASLGPAVDSALRAAGPAKRPGMFAP